MLFVCVTSCQQTISCFPLLIVNQFFNVHVAAHSLSLISLLYMPLTYRVVQQPVPPHIHCVSALPDITQNRNTALTSWSCSSLTLRTVILRASSTKLVANTAACMCKGKGMSLRTPTVIWPHNYLRVTSDTSKPVRTSGHHALNFIAVDLQLYKIFKIMRVSFFGTQCISASCLSNPACKQTSQWRRNERIKCSLRYWQHKIVYKIIRDIFTHFVNDLCKY